MKRLVLASVALVLTAPVAALAVEQPKPLILSLSDADRDGVVSDHEAAASLGSGAVPAAPVEKPAGQTLRVPIKFVEPVPGPLDTERRIVPASEFEKANEFRFREEARKRHKGLW